MYPTTFSLLFSAGVIYFSWDLLQLLVFHQDITSQATPIDELNFQRRPDLSLMSLALNGQIKSWYQNVKTETIKERSVQIKK